MAIRFISLGDLELLEDSLGYLNDLWAFNPSKNEWTWIGGSNTDGGSCTSEFTRQTVFRRVFTELLEFQTQQIFPEDGIRLSVGPTRAAISGSLAERLLTWPKCFRSS